MKDDENHRLNFCKRFASTNLSDSSEKVNFDDIYSRDHNKIKQIIIKIEKVWNTKSAHGTILKT